MKKLITLVIILAACVAAMACGNRPYYKTAEIVACEDGLVTVEDSNGDLWGYYDTEDQQVGQAVLLAMNGDAIVNVWYEN